MATKFGANNLNLPSGPANPPYSAPDYVASSVERALKLLQTDHIDLYYQHRVDSKVPIEIVLEALRPFVESGKIKWIGLSECNLDTLSRAKKVAGLGDKVIAAQMEFSPLTLDIEKSGFAEGAKKLGVSVVAYSPLARGLVSGRFRSRADFPAGDMRLRLPRWSEENFPKNLLLVDRIKDIADKLGRTPSQVTLAWILAEHSDCEPLSMKC